MSRPALHTALQTALSHHQRGDVVQAEKLYKAILADIPNQFDALHLLGILENQRANPVKAIKLFDRAIRVNAGVAVVHSNRGIALRDLKRYREALVAFDRALNLAPEQFEAHSNRGMVLAELGRMEEALASYERALAIQPAFVEALFNRGNTLRHLGRREEALASYDRALALRPDYVNAIINRGDLLAEFGRLEEALAANNQAVLLRPDFVEAYRNRAGVLCELNRLEEALADYDRALAIQPAFAEALFNRGNALRRLGRLDEALASYDRALALRPDYVDAIVNRGDLLAEFGRLEEALADYDRATALRPDDSTTITNRGETLRRLRRFDEALSCFDRVLALSPDNAEAHTNRGLILADLGRLDEALASHNRAIALRPTFAEAYSNRASALCSSDRFKEALDDCDRAVALRPDYAVAISNRGVALFGLNRVEEALACCDRAAALAPAHPEIQVNRAQALRLLNRVEGALLAFERAMALDPDHPFLIGDWVHAKLKACDWAGLAEAYGAVSARLQADLPASTPAALLSTPLSAGEQLACARTFVRRRAPAVAAPAPFDIDRRDGRIRLGYFSSDFRDHPVGSCIAEVIELHDRNQFEVLAFALAPPRNEPLTARLQRAFDNFIDISDVSPHDAAALARHHRVDIAIDLNGHTAGARTRIFAHRAAPVQASLIGYPGTIGAEYFDYLIADHVVVPDEHQAFYSEKIAYLPHAYLPRDRARGPGVELMTRQEAGLPEDGFVFCAFNNSYKITSREFDVWMRLLRQTPGSVLWLLADSALIVRNLQREAEARGVATERLVFAPRVERASQHLARQRLADLFLDSFAYNAHSTAGDALWVGLPVLTLLGDTFASRVAASLLTAAGLPELIAHSVKDYESRALELGRNKERLGDLTRRLLDVKLTASLFDTDLYTRHLEDAYRLMLERRVTGISSDHLYVAPR